MVDIWWEACHKENGEAHFTGCKVQKAYTSLGLSCHNAYTKSHYWLLMHICMRGQQWDLVYALWQEIPKLVYAFWTLQPVVYHLKWHFTLFIIVPYCWLQITTVGGGWWMTVSFPQLYWNMWAVGLSNIVWPFLMAEFHRILTYYSGERFFVILTTP